MWDPLGVQEITQNLKDAGCSPEVIEQFLNLMEHGTYREQTALLKRHRAKLLDALHTGQDQIGCLDYLLYQMQKQHSKSMKGEVSK